jgi:lipid-binding SYLF domain-containing protein
LRLSLGIPEGSLVLTRGTLRASHTRVPPSHVWVRPATPAEKELKMKTRRFAAALALVTLACTGRLLAQDKGKTEAAKLASESQAALKKLSATVPLAKELAKTAEAILVFPQITKAGLGIGGQYGEGTLLKNGTAAGYYKTTGASFGLQAGGQQYGYAMFFMNTKALDQLDDANGFEVGVGPSIVVVDEGMGKSSTTKTLKDDVYAFIFGQKGLMAGLGIQGNKITKITPK